MGGISGVGSSYSYSSVLAAQHSQDVAQSVEFFSELGSEGSTEIAQADTLSQVQTSLIKTQLQMAQDGIGVMLDMLV